MASSGWTIKCATRKASTASLGCILLCICSLQTAVTVGAKSLHLSYYTHEYRGGPNTTLLLAAGTGEGGNFSDIAWGSFVVFDNIMQEGSSANSKVLGKVTGFSVVTTLEYPVQWFGQHIFNDGPYNGSSFTLISGGLIPGATGPLQGYSGYGMGMDLAPDSGVYHVYKWDIHLSN